MNEDYGDTVPSRPQDGHLVANVLQVGSIPQTAPQVAEQTEEGRIHLILSNESFFLITSYNNFYTIVSSTIIVECRFPELWLYLQWWTPTLEFVISIILLQ